MKTIRVTSEVGSDGVVSLQVSVGRAEAHTRVVVTIEPAQPPMLDWPTDFFEQTLGCLEDEPLEIPPDPVLLPESVL